MKNIKKAMAVLLAVATVVTGFALPQTARAETTDNTPIYRLYNPDNGEHLYTTDANEKDELYKKYGWGYEGIAWYSANEGTPVYRLYNNVLCNHLYTTDLNEIKVLTSMDNTAWTVDNSGQPLFYSAGDVPIYRVYNEGLNGMHHLTTDKNEYDTLPTYGWAQEGVSLYAVSVGKPRETTYSAEAAYDGNTSGNLCPYPLWTILDFGDGWMGFYWPAKCPEAECDEKNAMMNEYFESRDYDSSFEETVGYYDDTYNLYLAKYHMVEN